MLAAHRPQYASSVQYAATILYCGFHPALHRAGLGRLAPDAGRRCTRNCIAAHLPPYQNLFLIEVMLHDGCPPVSVETRLFDERSGRVFRRWTETGMPGCAAAIGSRPRRPQVQGRSRHRHVRSASRAIGHRYTPGGGPLTRVWPVWPAKRVGRCYHVCFATLDGPRAMAAYEAKSRRQRASCARVSEVLSGRLECRKRACVES